MGVKGPCDGTSRFAKMTPSYLPDSHSATMLEQFRVFTLESGVLPWALVVMLALAVFVGHFIGRGLQQRVGGRKLRPDEISVTAIFGLMALLLSFTFSGAYDRFDQRRNLLVSEYNTISSAYQTVDLLPAVYQPKVREDFRSLMDQRIDLYKDIQDRQAFRQRIVAFDQVSNQLWKDAVAAVDATPYPKNLIAAQLLTNLNEMASALEQRRMALHQHPPIVIYTLLILMIITGAFVAGYNQATNETHDWTLVPVFVLLNVAVVYITINLEYPLIGIFNLEDFLHELIALRQSM
jgi:ABC-type antimicrobial peptide transport system permease subunit